MQGTVNKGFLYQTGKTCLPSHKPHHARITPPSHPHHTPIIIPPSLCPHYTPTSSPHHHIHPPHTPVIMPPPYPSHNTPITPPSSYPHQCFIIPPSYPRHHNPHQCFIIPPSYPSHHTPLIPPSSCPPQCFVMPLQPQHVVLGVLTNLSAGAVLQVQKFYTAPTLIRALMREGDHHVEQSDTTSLQVLGTVGEPINPEAWKWYHRVSLTNQALHLAMI